MCKAKIVVTIGPATQSPEMLRQLIEAGMDVARLNFSHGDHDTHRRTIRTIRDITKEMGKTVAVLQDLQGVKIRTGQHKSGQALTLEDGQTFTLTTEEIEGDHRRVSTSYAHLPKDVVEGDRVLLSDGSIEMEVVSTTETEVKCRVVSGGELAQRQGINLPGTVISAPALTDKDRRDLRFGIENEVDYIALSFVRKADDVQSLNQILIENEVDIPVIAKLEKPGAIDNLAEIMDVCEGVMVARGDLGVEIPPEKVPLLQKEIIATANRKGKLVITATQMLESMIRHPRPTRAEASDVANAVLDGTDALMLSGETAVGRYPVRTVRMMARIIAEAERVEGALLDRMHERGGTLSFPQAVCVSAYHASRSIQAQAIVAFTQSGSTARLISKYRPPTQILGFTPHPKILRRLALYWGVKPMLMHAIRNVDELIQALEELLLKHGLVKPGQNLIILTGAPIIEKGHTSLMKLHTVKG